jgi:hypothetical protein
MSNFDFTDLVLLVGTNPLPNYVVGKWFLGEKNQIKRIFLVHTVKTKEFATVIAKKLSQNNIEIHLLPLTSEAHGKTIRNNIETEWKKNKPNYNPIKIHINYTGGTKAMSIHTIQAFQEIKKQDSNISAIYYSYLEADKHQIYDDDQQQQPISSDLRKIIKITIEDIFYIHKFNPSKKGSNHIDNQERDQIQKEGKSITNADSGASVKQKLKNISKSNIKLGFVLEEYANYFIINDPDLKKNINDSKPNLLLSNPNWKQNRNCEIDILLIFGYELIGISCYAGKSIKVSKLKGFEIMHRIMQLGGEEAKSILLTGLEKNVKELEEELKIETGNDNILVLGLDDWHPDNLLRKIKEFIGVN